MIEAIFENGLFKPLGPVDWPEGTRVRIEPESATPEIEDKIRQQLSADGVAPAEIERILDNFRLLWSSYDSLTEEQKESLDQARLDQQNFFAHQPQP